MILICERESLFFSSATTAQLIVMANQLRRSYEIQTSTEDFEYE